MFGSVTAGLGLNLASMACLAAAEALRRSLKLRVFGSLMLYSESIADEPSREGR